MIVEIFTPLLFLVTIAVTAALAWVVGRHGLRLPAAMLLPAWRRTLECLGVVAIFTVANVVTGTMVIVAVRSATGSFFALYAISDVVILPLSLVEALAFWWWRVLSRNSEAPSRDRGG